MSTSGFIIDAPNVLIMTKKGDSHVCSAKKGEIKIGSDSLQISGGWSFYELANIDTKKKIEIDITDAEWKMDSMAIQTGGELKTGKAERVYFGDNYVVKDNKITLPFVIIPKSVRINGLTETDELAPKEKQFKVTIAKDNTEILFNTGSFANGVEIMPSFRVETSEDAEILSVKTTSFPKSGQAIVQYPIYGEDEAEEDNIIGYGQFTVYKTKIDSDSNIGGAYKTASEFSMKLKGVDPRRPDKKMFDFVFIPVVNE